MHLKSFRVVRQHDHSMVQPAQRFEPARFYQWLEKEKARAERVVVCYEAGCFGYEPARRMEAMGVEVKVIAPQNWDEQGKRQVNDKTRCERDVPATERISRRPPQSTERSAHSDSGRRSGSGASAISRATMQGTTANGSDGTQSPKPKGTVGARALVAGKDVGEKSLEGCHVWVVRQLEIWKELIEGLEKRIAEEEKQLRQSEKH